MKYNLIQHQAPHSWFFCLWDDVYRLSRYQIINYMQDEKVMGIKYLLMMPLMGKSVAASVQNAMNP